MVKLMSRDFPAHTVQVFSGQWRDLPEPLVIGTKDPLHVWVRFYGGLKCRVVRPDGSVMREFGPVTYNERIRFHYPWKNGFRCGRNV